MGSPMGVHKCTVIQNTLKTEQKYPTFPQARNRVSERASERAIEASTVMLYYSSKTEKAHYRVMGSYIGVPKCTVIQNALKTGKNIPLSHKFRSERACKRACKRACEQACEQENERARKRACERASEQVSKASSAVLY